MNQKDELAKKVAEALSGWTVERKDKFILEVIEALTQYEAGVNEGDSVAGYILRGGAIRFMTGLRKDYLREHGIEDPFVESKQT